MCWPYIALILIIPFVIVLLLAWLEKPATGLRIKRTSIPNNLPKPHKMVEGEIWCNLHDKKLFVKREKDVLVFDAEGIITEEIDSCGQINSSWEREVRK